MSVVTAVSLPPESLAAASLPRIDYADAYLARLPVGRRYTLDQAVTLVFATAPGWVKGLMQLRNALVRPFGLKVEPPRSSAARGGPMLPGARVGIFRVFDRRPDELLLGEDDRHLDFRVSVLLRDDDEQQWATVTTVVSFHNALGRAYFAIVRPFHQIIVPALIRRALRVAASSPHRRRQ
jgi:Protein of unknown function (DUF2867)